MNFIKTTAIGGLIFLIPIVIVSMILGKAFKIMMLVAVPLDKIIPIQSVGGIALANILAVLCILGICFLAGLAAKSKPGKKTFDMIDAKLVLFIPGYTYIKSIASSFADEEQAGKLFKPVIVKLDDQAQLAFEVERTKEGLVVVFLPGAPDPRSGNVVLLSPDRVEPLDSTFAELSQTSRRYGKGMGTLLNGEAPAENVASRDVRPSTTSPPRSPSF